MTYNQFTQLIDVLNHIATSLDKIVENGDVEELKKQLRESQKLAQMYQNQVAMYKSGVFLPPKTNVQYPRVPDNPDEPVGFKIIQ